MPGANQDDPNDKNNQPGAGDNPPPKDPPAGSGDDSGDDDDLGDFADPEKAKAEIKKLRQENAKRRTSAKDLETKFNAMNAKFERLQKALGGEEEAEDPETKLQKLSSHAEAMEFEASVNHLARVYEVPLEHDDYFRFLISQKSASLKEGEEIGEEEMKEIVGKVKAISGGPKKPSGTGAGGGQKPNGDADRSEVTLEQFKAMNTLEKSELYTKNPALYNKLSAQATSRR